jgi:cyclic pyranopterin phosphate synthase
MTMGKHDPQPADCSAAEPRENLGRVFMVDVSGKSVTARMARACVTVSMRPETAEQIRAGQVPKGDVLAASQIAAIMAVKHTAAILPLCHPIPVEGVTVDFQFGRGGELRIAVEVRSSAKTGVEMEALTGAAVAALCVYDMCKALDPGITVEKLALEYKSGGKSGEYRRQEQSSQPAG